MILSNLHSSMEITSCDPLVSTDIDTMLEALNEFKIVPQDYLYIIFSYGLLEFGTKPAGDGVRYNLMHPIDSYEFYFDTISGPLIIPGMYPFASGLGAANLYYGEIDGRLGVYSCINSPVSHEGMVFIANKFTDILRYGEGCEILKELGS